MVALFVGAMAACSDSAGLRPLPESLLVSRMDGLYSDSPDGTQSTRLYAGSVYEAAWSPDKQRVAFTARIDGTGVNVYVLDVASGAIRNAAPAPGVRDYSPRWSPDGTRIAFTRLDPSVPGSASQYLRDVDVNTGKLEAITPPGFDSGELDWSVDGTIYVSSAGYYPWGGFIPRLYAVRPGAPPARVDEPCEGGATRPHISPDGGSVAVTCRFEYGAPESTVVRSLRFGGDVVLPLGRTSTYWSPNGEQLGFTLGAPTRFAVINARGGSWEVINPDLGGLVKDWR
jgi:hypothetical protein